MTIQNQFYCIIKKKNPKTSIIKINRISFQKRHNCKHNQSYLSLSYVQSIKLYFAYLNHIRAYTVTHTHTHTYTHIMFRRLNNFPPSGNLLNFLRYCYSTHHSKTRKWLSSREQCSSLSLSHRKKRKKKKQLFST